MYMIQKLKLFMITLLAIALLSVIALLLIKQSDQTTTIPTGDSSELLTINVKPSTDSFVRQKYPTKNYSKEKQVTSDGDPRVTSLLSFDISSIDLNKVVEVELSITSDISRKVNKSIKLTTSTW